MPVIFGPGGNTFWQPILVPGCDVECSVRVSRPSAALMLKYRKLETVLTRKKVKNGRHEANLKYVPKLIHEFKKGDWIYVGEEGGDQVDLHSMTLDDSVIKFVNSFPVAVDALGDILFHATEGTEEPENEAETDDDAFSLPNSEERSAE